MPQQYARYKWESAYPELWPDYGWCPSIQPYGITTLYDQGGQDNHGTLNNYTLSTAWANPPMSGLVGNGSNSRTVMAQGFIPTSDWWVSAWVNCGTASQIKTVIAQPNSGNTDAEWGLYVLGIFSNRPSFKVHTNWATIFSGASITNGTWYHLVAGVTYNSQVIIWINGVPATWPLAFTPSASTQPMVIGNESATGAANVMDGGIDDVMVNRGTVTQGVVNALYAGGYGRGIAYTPRQQTIFNGAAATGNRRRRVIIGAA